MLNSFLTFLKSFTRSLSWIANTWEVNEVYKAGISFMELKKIIADSSHYWVNPQYTGE